MNPWLLEEDLPDQVPAGRATAAGLVGFSVVARPAAASWPEHALRCYGIASHLWPRTAHGGDDALLVTR